MLYFVKTPYWLQKLFPRRVWQMNRAEKKIYLSFDDGPHPDHTGFVLDELRKYKAFATFFCIGNNVKQYPEMFKRIIDEGHAIGNHTQNHIDGKKAADRDYINEVAEAANYIDSRLFRPPYGRLTRFREKLLSEMKPPYKIIMWTVLSGDFDPAVSGQSCFENILFKAGNGSIVVFHDSEKAAAKMRVALPKVLQSFSEKGFSFEKIEAGFG